MATAAKTPPADQSLAVHAPGLAYELDAGLGQRARIGLIVLASDQTIEHEFRATLAIPGVDLYHSRIANAATVTPETLAAMASDITRCTEVIMPGLPMDVIAYACTSGAMVIGAEQVRELIHAARPGIATTTPMESTAAALRRLGAQRICFIAPYLEEINLAMRGHLIEAGFQVPVMASWNESNDNLVARISPETIKEAVRTYGADAQSDAVFIACTSLRLADFVEELEAEIGKPVISSNTSIAWHCLRLAGYRAPVGGFGRLFRLGLD